MTKSMTNLIIDRYEIIQPLASGGFGQPFLARDTRMPSHRTVVIKKLQPVNQPNIDYQVIKDSFEQEAAVLEELGESHPQIPKLYDYFEEQGHFYLVQEYIEGKTLAQISPISQEQAFSILNSLLRTLQYLQDRNLIHRDIKPENIIIRNLDGLPVLIDFGAVKDTMGKVKRSSGSVISSVVIGTRGFMAPEQSEGSPIFSSDLYSLARTMIFALTNKLPIEMDKNMLTGKLDWQKYLPTIDPALVRVLDTASQLSPERRYPTAEEMNRDLHSSQSRASQGKQTEYSQTPSGRETVRIPEEFHPSYQSNSSEPVQKQSIGKMIALVSLGVVVLSSVVIGSFLLTKHITDLNAQVTSAKTEEKKAKEDAAIAQEKAKAEAEAARAKAEAEAAKAEAAKAEAAKAEAAKAEAARARAEAEAARARAEAEAARAREKAAIESEPLFRFNSPPSSSSSSSRPNISLQPSCGSTNYGEREWWAVKTDKSNLNLIKNQYCGDAYTSSNGETQVASFTSEYEAKRFAEKLNAHSGEPFWIRQSIRR